MGLSSFMLGLATAFLVCASFAFAFDGRFGFQFMVAGGACAGASVAVTLSASRRARKAAPDPGLRA